MVEGTALSIGKSALSGALSYANSVVAEEVALQLGVRLDQVFITNELEMMQAFLMAADSERDDNMVVKVWVKQVRDVAYDVEDTLHEFAVCLRKESWWRIFRTLYDRRRVATRMKELRTNVEDVSQRNMCYNLIKDSCSKVTMVEDHSSRRFKMVADLRESHLVGRDIEKQEIINLILNQDSHQCRVISVWGMGGLGKTTIVKDVIEDQVVSGAFDKHACVTIMRPLTLVDLVRSLVGQMGMSHSSALASPGEWIGELERIIRRQSCLFVLDDLSSTAEWDLLLPIVSVLKDRRSCILVTTRDEIVARYCSKKQEYVYKLQDLDYKDARDLFTRKVFKNGIDLDVQYPELVEQAEQILLKCKRLPLAIAIIGGFLASQPKTVAEWKKLNENIGVELELNPEFGTIRTILMRSYDGLPYHLKSCCLYMPIFPENSKLGRGRLVRRWTAEGYPREIRGKSLEEIADGYFMELVSRSIILPSETSFSSAKRIDSYHVHGLMHDLTLSKAMDENLVFTLEDGCSSNNRGTVRHLAIKSNWNGDKGEFESKVDLSRVRSVTVFGEYKSFYVSEQMRVVRVLDLEDCKGLCDHHLKQIGKLFLLRYLSLRGCKGIFHLPRSLGYLRELLTLDVRDTRIIKLPKSIVNLDKLNNLYAGAEAEINWAFEILNYDDKSSIGSTVFWGLARSFLHCSAPSRAGSRTTLETDRTDLGMVPSDACSALCCSYIPAAVMDLDLQGVLVPSGMRKMKALHKLGVVNIGRNAKVILHEIKELTQLRKFGVTGVSIENGRDLCLAVHSLERLESLSIRSEGLPGLYGCLNAPYSFPNDLQSLKLYGNLLKLPQWIKGLKNLVKLKLQGSMITDYSAAMQVLGDLPNLASLHLLTKSFTGNVTLEFFPATFKSLVWLLLDLGVALGSVKFERRAAPKLEVIQFADTIRVRSLSGLRSLEGLKQVVFNGHASRDTLAFLRGELASHPNRPTVRVSRC